MSYLLGSISFASIAGWVWGVDIRKYGSGNLGTANVLRVLGPIPAALVLTCDLLKGTLSTILAIFLLEDPTLVILCGLAAVAGHMFSIFLGFQGGRGVATSLGVLLGIAPDLFLMIVAWAILIIILTRFVSLASITGAIFLPMLMFIFDKPLPYAWTSVLIAVLIIIKHIPNLKRLLNGTEPKIGEKARV